MARASSTYHTLIFTCCLVGISVLDYFEHVFSELSCGDKEYANLLPRSLPESESRHLLSKTSKLDTYKVDTNIIL